MGNHLLVEVYNVPFDKLNNEKRSNKYVKVPVKLKV